MLITGPERMGKSTLAFKLGRALDPTFDHRRMVFTQSAHVRLSQDLGRYRVIVSDEGTEGLFRRNAMKSENRDFAEYLFVCGDRNQVHLLIIPSKEATDPITEGHRAMWWLYVPRRGAYEAAEAIRSKHSRETWWQPRFDGEFTAAADDEWRRYGAAKTRWVRELGRDASRLDEEDEFAGHVRTLVDQLAWVPEELRGWRPRPPHPHGARMRKQDRHDLDEFQAALALRA